MATNTLAYNVARVKNFRDGSREAIIDMGVTVPPNTEVEDYPDLIRSITGGGGQADLPQLNAVSLSRSGDTVYISNPSSNGGFVQAYRIYNGNTLLRQQTGASFSLIGLGAGDYNLTVTAYAEKFRESPASNALKVKVVTVTQTLENLTSTYNYSLISSGIDFTTTLRPASGLYLPEDIIVTMGGAACRYEYDSYTGALTIPSVSGNIVIEAIAYTAAKLRRPTLEIDGTTLTVTPPRYAEQTDTYIDNELAWTYTGS